MRDLERWKDKVELSLDGRQIFFLFFGSAVAACLIFVSGMLVGKRIERRTLVAATQTAEDPLAALDQLGAADDDDGLTFHQTLAAAEHRSSGKHDDDGKRVIKPEPPATAKPDAVIAAKSEAPKVVAAGAQAKPETAQKAPKVESTEKAAKIAAAQKSMKTELPQKSVKSENSQKSVKTENPQKIAKTEPSQKLAKVDPSQKLTKIGASQKSVKTEAAQKSVKTEAPQKLAKPEVVAQKSVKSGVAQKLVKSERPNKAESVQKPPLGLDKASKPVDGAARAGEVVPPRSDAKSKERFTLQLSAFPDRGEAEQFLQKMQSAGYKPFLVQSDVPGHGVYFRVRVGDYSNRKAAADAKADFERRQHLIAYVAKL